MANIISQVARLGIVQVLRHRSFAHFVGAHFASVIGLWVQRIGIQWLAWDLSGSYAWLGTIAMAEAFTIIITSLLGGPLADRLDRVKFSFFTQTLLMIAACALAALVFFDLITLTFLALFVMVTGAIEGVWAPVRLALIPNLVPRQDMPAAVSLTSMVFMVAVIIGPAISGLLIATVGTEGAFTFNALTYVGLLILFSRLRLENNTLARKISATFLQDLKSGFAYVATTRSLRTMVAFGFFFSLLVRPIRDLLAGIADGLFQAGPEGLAALASASGIGGLLGSMVIGVYGKTTGLSKTLGLISGLAALTLVGITFSESFTLTIVLVGLITAFANIFGTSAHMLIQMSIPDEMRGRVMSVWLAQFRNAPSLGAFLIGMAEPLIGFRMALGLCCVLFLLFIFLTLTWRTSLRELELEPVSSHI